MSVDKITLIIKVFFLILWNKVPNPNPIRPYKIILTSIAPMKVEYLASGPNVNTAWDSISPEAIEIKLYDATSGKGHINK